MSGDQPLVSVIMPSYNVEKVIGQSIDSVLGQTYRAWELLVSDDGSTDDTVGVVEGFAKRDARVRLIRGGRNRGAAAARNSAIKAASGRYIAFLDSDDLWRPEKLERQVAFMEAKHCALSATAYEEVDECGDPTGRVLRPCEKAGYWKILFLGNPLGNSTVMYDAGAIGKFYAPEIKKRNDFALWLAIARRGNVAYGLDECLAIYRVRSLSLSSDKAGLISYQWSLYREVEGLNVLVSAAAMVSWACVKVVRKIGLLS